MLNRLVVCWEQEREGTEGRVGKEHWEWRSGIGWEERKSIKMGLEPGKTSVGISQLDRKGGFNCNIKIN